VTIMLKPYDHQAIEWTEDGQRECRRCGTPITGWGPALRHLGEAVRPATIPSTDKDAIHRLTELGARALADMWTDRCTDRDRARVIVEAFYQAGALNTRKHTRTAV
jgi:hypothetical protein